MKSLKNLVFGDDESTVLTEEEIEDLRLEIRQTETEIELAEQKLEDLEDKFQEAKQDTNEETGSEKNRRTAQQIAKEFEVKKGEFESDIEELIRLKYVLMMFTKLDEKGVQTLEELNGSEALQLWTETVVSVKKDLPIKGYHRALNKELESDSIETQSEFSKLLENMGSDSFELKAHPDPVHSHRLSLVVDFVLGRPD